jgi:hypothetical protein
MDQHAAAVKRHAINVHVVFPLSPGKPFNERTAADATVGGVRGDAMARFGVTDDPQYTYYLTHDGDRLDNERTVGDIAGHAHSLKVTLVKELLQG